MDNVLPSLDPTVSADKPLRCGCIRGVFLCPEAVRLWERYKQAATLRAAQNAWNRYWRHMGDETMTREGAL